VNLPNVLTVGRIVAAPLVAVLPFLDSWAARLAAFALFILTAVTDYYDGKLARSRNLVTRLGTLLDPLADKLLLLATLIPMYLLMREPGGPADAAAVVAPLAPGPVPEFGVDWFPFVTPFGEVPLAFWVVAVVLGRELFMTLFRQVAARRGVVIGAIGPAKWKTGFQWTWVGASFFWFANATLAADRGWLDATAWRAFAWFNALVGVVAMAVAVALTLYSMLLYLRRYGGVMTRGRREA
jgi:CDP-diacylglycerol--glycerol-3-phosphate 3-phosphatidyltransferase